MYGGGGMVNGNLKKLILDGKKWVREGDDFKPKDVSTLLRNILIHKLISVFNFKVLQILSKSGENIYILIYADDNCLKKEADRVCFNLEIEIGAIDLLSLEPIDSNLRPLRFLSRHKKDHIKQKEKELEPLYDLLYFVDDNSKIALLK